MEISVREVTITVKLWETGKGNSGYEIKNIGLGSGPNPTELGTTRI